MTPYKDWMAQWMRLLEAGDKLPLGNGAAAGGGGMLPPVARALGTALLCMPHPDDECITGALPLRWRQRGMRVISAAVTLGSLAGRRAARRKELRAACARLGFEPHVLGGSGLEQVHPQARRLGGAGWRNKVQPLYELMLAVRPRMVVFPHVRDAHRTHQGAYWLVRDALAAMPADFEPWCCQTEYWAPMPRPNAMVEVDAGGLAVLLAALACHAGELRRNPYHLGLPAWMLDNTRRGAERIGGQGGSAPAMRFTTLYHVSRWRRGRMRPAFMGPLWLPGHRDPLAAFPDQDLLASA